MALQLIVHHLIDPIVNEIRNVLDVHPVVIDDAVRKNPPKSKQKQSSHLQQNTPLDFCVDTRKRVANPIVHQDHDPLLVKALLLPIKIARFLKHQPFQQHQQRLQMDLWIK